MKLKRFNAPDIKQAIASIREELGPDAVILSNRNTGHGVELIAAIDYDDTLFDQDSAAIEKAVSESLVEQTQTAAPSMQKAPALPAQRTAHKAQPDVLSNSYADRQEQADHGWVKELKKTSQQQTPVLASKGDSFVNHEEPAPSGRTIAVKKDSKSVDGIWGELQQLRGLLETQLSSFTWGDLNKRFPQRAKALRHLLELGVSPATAKKLLEQVEESDYLTVWKKSLNIFSKTIPVVAEDVVEEGGVIALVGPTGVGKTTTLAKMAARYALVHGTRDIALITTDNYRVGAQEQLRTYGRILDCPVHIANDAQELKRVLRTLFDKKLVLIDTAGMSQRDMRLNEQFSLLSEGSTLIKTFMVMATNAQLTVMDEVVRAFKKGMLDGCILTKLDETVRLGGALSIVSHHKLPIAYISDGQRVPEDLHKQSAIELIKRAITMAQKQNNRMDEDVLELAFGGALVDDHN